MTTMFNTLALSNMHLPERLGADGLDKLDNLPIDPLEGGWLVYVPDYVPSGVIPLELFRVLQFAHRNGCRFIHFHCNNDTTDELPTWEW